MITRKDYMSKKATHREYFSQFVNEEILKLVEDRFGRERLKKAFETDRHFNSIRLDEWDFLNGYIWPGSRFKNVAHNERDYLKKLIDLRKLKETGEGYSLNTCTCILKEAAQMIIERPEVTTA